MRFNYHQDEMEKMGDKLNLKPGIFFSHYLFFFQRLKTICIYGLCFILHLTLL